MKRVLCLLVLASAVHAQAPDADWRTVTTKHFRVHYPAPYEAWTMRAASRLESIRDAVAFIEIDRDLLRFADGSIPHPRGLPCLL